MSVLNIGGLVIPVAASGVVSRARYDAVDRARAFDGSYRVSVTGTPKRDWTFTTPPVTRALADQYELTLSNVIPMNCSGDIIGNNSNQLLWSSDFSNTAVWVRTTMDVTAGITDPTGGYNAQTLTATGASGSVNQNLSAGASVARVNSVWMRRRTGVGLVRLFAPDNTTFASPSLTSNWQRVSSPSAASTVRDFNITISASGDAVDAWIGQLEDGTTATTETVTTTAPVLTPLPCCPEITDWQAVKVAGAHYVVISFQLHEV